jgi:tetratricopeptide (TPR) repeat protein
MPNDQQQPLDTPDPVGDSAVPKAPVPKHSGRRISACLIALVAIPLFIQWCPSEIALWKQASARIAWDNGDHETALKLTAEAANWDPNSTPIKLDQARWHEKMEEYQAAIDLYISLLPDEDNSSTASLDTKSIALRMTLCDVLNRQAIATRVASDALELPVITVPSGPSTQASQVWQQWQIIDRWYQVDDRLASLPILATATYYNNRAYQIAISGDHITEALHDINRCLDLLGGDIMCLFAQPMSHVQGAYQSYQAKEILTALEQLNTAISFLAQHHAIMPEVEPEVEPSAQWEDSQVRIMVQRSIDFRKMYGRVLLFRAQLLRQVNEPGDAELDSNLAIKFGTVLDTFQPEVFSSTFLITSETANFVGMALDTRGLLHLLNNQPQLAQEDLNQAVKLVSQYLHQTVASVTTEKGSSPSPMELDKYLISVKRQLAVVFYHRSLVLMTLDKTEAAQRDLQRVRELGFEPSPMLF